MTSNALEPQASTARPLTTVMVVMSGWSLVAIKIRLEAVATTVPAVPYLGVEAGPSRWRSSALAGVRIARFGGPPRRVEGDRSWP